MSSDSTPRAEPVTRWSELYGADTGTGYAKRLAEIAASGQDMHGEASFCASLVSPPARILDAGCGTGRVAIRLLELEYDCVGVDADASMLRLARLAAPAIPWMQQDLSALDLDGPPFDLVLAAGNVIPLLAPGTLEAAVERLAAAVTPGGYLVCGFGLDSAHLPPRCPVTSLPEFDAACDRAGLTAVERWSTWDRAPQHQDPGYVVVVHRR